MPLVAQLAPAEDVANRVLGALEAYMLKVGRVAARVMATHSWLLPCFSALCSLLPKLVAFLVVSATRSAIGATSGAAETLANEFSDAFEDALDMGDSKSKAPADKMGGDKSSAGLPRWLCLGIGYGIHRVANPYAVAP